MTLNLKTALIIWIIFESLLRIIAIYYVPRNRKPSSAMAWLMFIMLFPSLGMTIYLLIGSPKLSKTRRAKQRLMDYLIQKAAEESIENPAVRKYVHFEATDRINHLVKLTNNLSGMPAFSGNKVSLLAGYDDNIAAIIKDIDSARKFVDMEFYIIALDQTTEPLFDAMARAVKRGVKIRVLFDYVGSKRMPNFTAMKKRLNEVGAEWYPMLPLKLPGKNFNRPDLRNHRKLVVIDALIGYTGSQNMVKRNYHRRGKLYYDELIVRVSGPIVVQLQAVFITDWYSESDILLTLDEASELVQMIEPAGDTLAQVMPSGPGYENDNNLKLFTTLIHQADSRVVLVNPYFVPDDSLMIALTSAAQRGVEVIMINSEIIDQRLVGHAQRSYYEELLRAGVKIMLYNSPVLLHAKYMTIDDDIAAVGSSNLDMRSFQLNLEVTLLVYDKTVVTDFKKLTVSYQKHSKVIKLEDWQARPIRSKLLDNLARLTASLQ